PYQHDVLAECRSARGARHALPRTIRRGCQHQSRATGSDNVTDYPKISVVVPSFNQGRYIEQTLCSIIYQSYPNLELIVIDGGSTDDSVEIIQDYQRAISYWVSEPDGGQTQGLIKGFHHATGDILCWLNADDMHEPHTLEEIANFFTATPEARFVYGN